MTSELKARLAKHNAGQGAGQEVVAAKKEKVVLPVLNMAKAEKWYKDLEKYPDSEHVEIDLSHPSDSQREAMGVVAIANIRVLGVYLPGAQVRYDKGNLFVSEASHKVEGAGYNGGDRYLTNYRLPGQVSAMVLRMVEPMLIFPEEVEEA